DRRIRLDGRSTGDSGGMAPATVEGTNRSRGTIMRIHSLAAFSLILAAIPATASAAPAGTVAAALAAPDRRPDNVKLDDGRKPAAVLQFLGLKPGMKVLDLFGANGYWAEIMVPVVGPKGHDTIWQPTQFYGARGKSYMEGF